MCGAPHSSGFVPFRPRAPVPEKRDDPIPHHHHLTRSFCPKSKERERVEIPFYPTDPKPKRPGAGWITAERKRGGRARHGAGGRQGAHRRLRNRFDRPKALEVKPWPHTHTHSNNKRVFFFFAKRRTEEEHARRVEGKKSALHDHCQLCEQQEYWVNKPKAGL